MEDHSTVCPKCGEPQLNADARFCHHCGEPILPPPPTMPASAVKRRANPVAWLVPVTLVLALAVLALLWQVVFGSGLSGLLPWTRSTPIQIAAYTPVATLAPTATPRNLLVPTSTSEAPTPTALPSSDATSQPTSGPSPTPSAYGRVTGTEGELLNVRAGPGIDYEILTQLEEGDPVLVLGRNDADDWLRIRTQTGQQGWVARAFIANDMPPDRLPVYTPEPTRLMTPTPEGDPFFRADVTSLRSGECTTLRWDVDGVREVYIDGVGVAGHASLPVCPIETRTFKLRVVRNDGSAGEWEVTIRVLPADSAAFTLAYRGCIDHDMQLGQVKGQVFAYDGRVVPNALVEILVDGQAGVVPLGRTNEQGWYEFNLRDGQVARFVRLEVGWGDVPFAPMNYEVTARSGCYQRIDFQQN